jgi:hypothetical protein
VVLGVVVAAIGFLFFPFSLAPALLLEIVGALLGGIAWEQPLGRHAAIWGGVLAGAVTLFGGMFFVYALLSGKSLLI